MLYSFDVFDTVITRRTASPKGIFAIMQERLLMDAAYCIIPERVRRNFFELRVGSEKYARTHYLSSLKNEIDIHDIYRAMNMGERLTQEDVEMLIKLEINIEMENVLPIASAIQLILRLLEENQRVIFISDMYLGKDIIRKMLKLANRQLRDIEIYVSCDIGRTKQSGMLYYAVRDIEGVDFKHWTHYGDNKISDYSKPKELGINAIKVKAHDLLHIERDYLDKFYQKVSAQLYIGASVYSRYFLSENSAVNVGTSIAGVILNAYVIWVLKRAISLGFKTLYFIARDGYILKGIADIFIKSLGLAIQTRYIYGSRESWRLPSVINEERALANYYYQTVTDDISTINDLSALLGVTCDDMLDYLPNLKVADVNMRLSRLDLDIIVEKLDLCEEFRKHVIEIQSDKRKKAIKYLIQEINFLEQDIAFVDVGGTAFTQKCIYSLISNYLKGDLYCFYYHIYGKNRYDEKKAFVYSCDEVDNRDAIEPLCRALQGQTIQYSETNGKISPIFADFDLECFTKCKYDDYLESVYRYSEVVSNVYKDLLAREDELHLINKYWDYYVHSGDKELLDFVGEVPFDTKGSETGRKYAPLLDDSTVKSIINDGVDKDAWYYNGEWAFRFCLDRLPESDKKRIIGSEKAHKSKHVDQTTLFAHVQKRILEKYQSIIVYGAGALGKAVVNDIHNYDKCKLCAWVDKNSLCFQSDGYNIIPPESIKNYDFELLIISIVHRDIANEVYDELRKLGVDMSKVLYEIDDYLDCFIQD